MFNRFQDQSGCQCRAGLFLLVIVLFFALTANLVYYLFFKPQTVVAIEFDNERCIIKDKFELKWIHSVEKQWWIEAYQVETHNSQPLLLLTDTYLQTFGAGTPSTEALGWPDDKHPGYAHYLINTRLPYLNWMISSNIKAQIIVNPINSPAYTLPIYQWVDDYTNIYISARTQNLWNLRRQESCDEYTPRR